MKIKELQKYTLLIYKYCHWLQKHSLASTPFDSSNKILKTLEEELGITYKGAQNIFFEFLSYQIIYQRGEGFIINPNISQFFYNTCTITLTSKRIFNSHISEINGYLDELDNINLYSSNSGDLKRLFHVLTQIDSHLTRIKDYSYNNIIIIRKELEDFKLSKDLSSGSEKLKTINILFDKYVRPFLDFNKSSDLEVLLTKISQNIRHLTKKFYDEGSIMFKCDIIEKNTYVLKYEISNNCLSCFYELEQISYIFKTHSNILNGINYIQKEMFREDSTFFNDEIVDKSIPYEESLKSGNLEFFIAKKGDFIYKGNLEELIQSVNSNVPVSISKPERVLNFVESEKLEIVFSDEVYSSLLSEKQIDCLLSWLNHNYSFTYFEEYLDMLFSLEELTNKIVLENDYITCRIKKSNGKECFIKMRKRSFINECN